MSVWTHIEGTVKIHKDEKISIKQLIEDVFTDEFCLDLKTETFPDYYRHTISCNVCFDGWDFVKKHKEFFAALKPMSGGMDLTFELRFLG